MTEVKVICFNGKFVMADKKKVNMNTKIICEKT